MRGSEHVLAVGNFFQANSRLKEVCASCTDLSGASERGTKRGRDKEEVRGL